MNDKIKPHHRDRKAVLYIRQSSAYQVANNLESQKLQYGMRDRLDQLGWKNIEVIDEDLGQTASGVIARSGFEKLVAAVCLGEVGAVAARELSRFARNSREWQQLIDMCRVVDTILIDNEQVYSPRISNDRLLLGLKGNLNEYELDVLRQRSLEARYDNGVSRKVTRRRDRSEWIAFIPDHHEGYISLEQHEEIRRMIDENHRGFQKTGAVRRGPALLSGLFRCRRCGRKLTVAYSGAKTNRFARYCCVRGHLDIGEPKCIAFGAAVVDAEISQQVLRVVRPSALEASRLAMEKLTERADQVLDALQSDLQAAQYQAARAEKQYHAADPDNRLVTDELERRWNASLQAVADLERRISDHRGSREQPTADDWEALQDLATDLESVWESEACDERVKKRILRTLIKEILVDLDAAGGEIHLTIHWHGGVHTSLTVPRRKRGCAAKTSADTIEAVRQLALIANDEMIAGLLNRNGLVTGKGNRFTCARIVSLRNYHKIPIHDSQEKEKNGWMTLSEAAEYLEVSPRTLRLATDKGEIPSRHPLAEGPWIFQRMDLDTETAQIVKRRARSRRQKGAAVPNPNQQKLDFSGT